MISFVTEHQTTNLGVRSSNLFGRASKINYLAEICQVPLVDGVNGGVNNRVLTHITKSSRGPRTGDVVSLS